MAAAAPNVAMICIQSIEPFSGQIFHRYSEEPLEIRSTYEICVQIDKLCDEIGYPNRDVSMRSFREHTDVPRRNYREANRVMSFSQLTEKNGSQGTFMVHVQFRQNATWQGQVTWMEKKETQNFRSALELMKLIDRALDAEQDESKSRSCHVFLRKK